MARLGADSPGRLGIAVCALIWGACSDAPPPTAWQVTSPDGRLVVELALQDGLEQRVRYDEREVVSWSPLGLESTHGDFTSDLQWLGQRRRTIDDRYATVVGKRRARRHRASELTLRLSDTSGNEIAVDVRAADDGAAYRYRLLGEGTATVLGETSGFRLPEGAQAWMQPYDRATPFGPAYEEFPKQVETGASNPQNGWSYGALVRLPESSTYVLLAEAGLTGSYAATHLGQPAGPLYPVAFPGEGEGNGIGDVDPVAPLPLTTPWRTMIVGDLAAIVESTLVDDLSPPPTQGRSVDEDWLRPGRSAWSWWSQNTGLPALQREYVDFASALGWEYVLVDANWTDWESPDRDVPDLVSYAADRGVSLFLWYNSGGPNNVVTERPRDLMYDGAVRRAEMARIAAWGVRGIKVDFFHSDKQDRIRQYLAILDDAWEHRLLVNFHGSTLPRGWQRTYPNLMSMEAVHGAEYYRLSYGPSALDNVRLVFTRNVLGSMDYTPITFAAALAQKQISYAHQLALAVVFESGVQHFADRADSNPDEGFRKVFADAPFARDLLSSVPTVWDETRLLSGDPDSHAVLARRAGDTWYVAGISGAETELSLALDLGFLTDSSYDALLITSGDAPDRMTDAALSLGPDDDLRVTLGARDGFVARLRPRRTVSSTSDSRSGPSAGSSEADRRLR